MPNHVTSRIKLVGSEEKVREIIKKYGTEVPARLNLTADEEEIICKDSNKPDSWSCGWYNPKTGIFITGHGDTRKEVQGLPEGWEMGITPAYTHFPDLDKVVPEPDEVKQTHGASGWNPDWMAWRREHWGTKWNTYEPVKVSDNTFEFQTAWNGIPAIIKEMSKNFPDVYFIYMYADEDTGSNTGMGIFYNGMGGVGTPENQSIEAYNLAFELNPHQKEYYELVDGQYRFTDED